MHDDLSLCSKHVSWRHQDHTHHLESHTLRLQMVSWTDQGVVNAFSGAISGACPPTSLPPSTMHQAGAYLQAGLHALHALMRIGKCCARDMQAACLLSACCSCVWHARLHHCSCWLRTRASAVQASSRRRLCALLMFSRRACKCKTSATRNMSVSSVRITRTARRHRPAAHPSPAVRRSRPSAQHSTVLVTLLPAQCRATSQTPLPRVSRLRAPLRARTDCAAVSCRGAQHARARGGRARGVPRPAAYGPRAAADVGALLLHLRVPQEGRESQQRRRGVRALQLRVRSAASLAACTRQRRARTLGGIA